MRMVDICIDEMPNVHDVKINARSILRDVCSVFGYKEKDFASKNRETEYVFCRSIISYVGRVIFDFRQSDIADVIGYEERSSVSHSLKRINTFFETGDELFKPWWEKYTKESKIWRRYGKQEGINRP